MDCEGKNEFGNSTGRFREYLFLLYFSRNIVSDQVKVCLLFLCHLPHSKLSFIFLTFGTCVKIFLGEKKISNINC